MDGDTQTGQVKLRQGTAIVVPAKTVIWLDNPKLRSVLLNFIAEEAGEIRHVSTPTAERKAKSLPKRS
jgi:predicted N-acyltransferase